MPEEYTKMRDAIYQECLKGKIKPKKGEDCHQCAKRIAAIRYYKRHGRTPMQDEKKAELVSDVYELMIDLGFLEEDAADTKKHNLTNDHKDRYGDVEYADPKNHKYPIDTEEHIRAAWNYIHKEHNQSFYTPSQVKAIKRRIIAAWKKKIDKAGPPSAQEGNK